MSAYDLNKSMPCHHNLDKFSAGLTHPRTAAKMTCAVLSIIVDAWSAGPPRGPRRGLLRHSVCGTHGYSAQTTLCPFCVAIVLPTQGACRASGNDLIDDNR